MTAVFESIVHAQNAAVSKIAGFANRKPLF